MHLILLLCIAISTGLAVSEPVSIQSQSKAIVDYSSVSKPWHIRMPRQYMLAAWQRLVSIEIPGIQLSQRFSITGQEFYVSNDGDDRSDGSKERPWKTLAHAAKQLKPNTVIYLKGGTYYGPVILSVKANAHTPAALRAAQGEEVIITYPESFIAAEKARMANSKADSSGDSLHYAPLINIRGTYLEVSGLHLVGVRDKLPHNLYSECGVLFTGGGGPGCRVLYNEVENVGHCGVKEQGHGGHSILIEGNYIHDLGQTFHDHGIYCPADDVTVRKNILTNTTGWGLHAYSNPQRILVSHNIAAGNDQHGLIFAGPDATVTHNILFRNHSGGVFFFRSGAKNCKVANNVFIESAAFQFDCCGDRKLYPSGNKADYNCLVPPTKPGTKAPDDDYGSHNVIADPGFVNTEWFDFRLRENGSLIDAGDKSIGPYRGKAPDIGLYEIGRNQHRSTN